MNRLKQDDFYDYRFLSRLKFSPSGALAALTAARVNAEENAYDSVIWLYRGGAFTQLTAMDAEREFIWKNDREILFFSVRSKADKKRAEAKEQFTPVYCISVDGGEAVKAFELPFAAQSIELLPDGRYLVAGSIDACFPDYYKMDPDARAKVAQAYKDETDYQVCDEVPFWFNGAGYTNKQRTALFLYDGKENTCRRITEPLFNLDGFEVLGDCVYYYGEEYSVKPTLKADLYEYNLKTNRRRTVRDDKALYLEGSAVLGDSLIMLAGTREQYGINEDLDFCRVDTKTGETELLYKVENAVGNSTGSDCRLGPGRMLKGGRDALWFTYTTRNACHLCKLTADGKMTRVIAAEGSVDDFDVCEESGQVLSVRMGAASLQEVWSCDAAGEGLAQVSAFNAAALKNKYVAEPHKLTVRSAGTDIDGWVLYPYRYDESKSYPAVLDIHGGPKTVYGELFYHEMQYWASEGYFVFFCNPTGSDGRGNDFADIRGKYGTVDYQNIMDFTDAVLEAYPQIDKQRVCVTGGSYGGFMTNWMVGHTDRFCCAATQRSISDWFSFYGVSDIGEFFGNDQQAADIFTGAEKLWEHSPLKYAGNVKTPILFIHSDEDYRCPLCEGVQFYTAVASRGVPARMCIFHGENHELSRSGKPKHRSRRLKEITDWFRSYTK